MTRICTLRFWLLTGASCLLAGQVQAQSAGQLKPTPPYGAPTMVQAAPSFTDLTPQQIAADVTQQFNPRTGQLEWVGASFDPFERDPGLAASVRLTSTGGVLALDGQPLGDGALLDVNFYYNSPSDDPFGGRGYTDAAFLNGELATPVTRDNRILECSTRVENVVYEHQAYYGGPALGFFRPQPRYFGHFGFADQGFGLGFNNGFGRNFIGNGFGFGGFGFNNRRFNNRNVNRLRGVRRDNRELDNRDARREREEERRLRGGPLRGVNAVRRLEIANPEAAAARRQRIQQRRETAQNRESLANDPRARGLAGRALSTGRFRLERPQNQADVRQAPAPQTSAPQTSAPQTSAPRAQPRAQPRSQNRSQPRAQPRSQPRSAPRSQPRRQSRPAPRRAAPSRAAPRRSLPRPSINNRSKRQLNFFPNSGAGVNNVVSTTSIDCAREETLRVFIPAERLDAARFDGLTMVVLDREGGQTPLFIPPNYIQGFGLAASGQVSSSGVGQNVPNGTLTRVPQPTQRFETAACPAGTKPQADGTCLLSSGRN